LWIANGNHTVEQFSSSLGSFASRSADREGFVDAERRGRGLGAEAVAVPDLALQVLRRAEQRGAAVARQHQPGVGLGEAGQVIEVAVVPVQEVGVAVARALGRGRDDGDAVLAELRGEARAALGVDRGGVC
jgi:hypothetical protein